MFLALPEDSNIATRTIETSTGIPTSMNIFILRMHIPTNIELLKDFDRSTVFLFSCKSPNELGCISKYYKDAFLISIKNQCDNATE